MKDCKTYCQIYSQVLSGGMTCFTIPKKGYESKQAAIAVKCGGTESPPGIAHFLEHKLFEDHDLNLFDEFTSMGASVNAYTHFTHTVYYFSTIDAFDKNLEMLFRLVQQPHITEENVEKEKGIILSEIDMYADNPYWQVYTGLHRALFHNSSLNQDILGTKESVRDIMPIKLYDFHYNFYTPDNMALIAIGDFEANQIIEWAEHYSQIKGPHVCKRESKKEPAHAAIPFIAKHMSVSIPLFQLGFKAVYSKEADPTTIAASGLLVDIIAGESSKVYSDLYSMGMIDNQFAVDYIVGINHGIFIFAGASIQPEAVKTHILQAIKGGIRKERFEVIKGKHIGRYIRGFNSVDMLSSAQAELFTRGQDIPTMLEAVCNLRFEDVEAQLHEHLHEENCALSVIWPEVL